MKLVSLFSGCGGMDLGFEKAGYDVIWANEFDASIHSTYTKNHVGVQLEKRDVTTLLDSDIPDCDGIIGGPPCQAWSEGGKQLGIKDPRGRLFFEYIRIVKAKHPKFFVIENVRGILDDKHKQAFQSFIQMLIDCGYSIDYAVVNTADFQIPQDRIRVFIVGIREELCKHFLFPNPVDKPKVTLRQAIGDIVDAPIPSSFSIPTYNVSQYSNHHYYSGDYDAKYMARNRVRSWDEVSFTIQALAKNAPIHPQAPKMQYINPNLRCFRSGYEHLYRRLSIRECARIQTFPDSFIFYYSNIQDGYKMVGNAVPPRMAEFIANRIKEII